MPDYTFPLQDTTPSTADAGFESSFDVLDAFADTVGIGVVNPFRRGPSDFVAAGGSEFLQSMIAQVLGTRSGSDFTEGELPWRSEFGSLLHLLRHRNNNEVTAELARVYVADALARWVPQVRLKKVETSRKDGPGGEENVLQVRITYDVIGLNRPGNEVLVPDLSQVLEV